MKNFFYIGLLVTAAPILADTGIENKIEKLNHLITDIGSQISFQNSQIEATDNEKRLWITIYKAYEFLKNSNSAHKFSFIKSMILAASDQDHGAKIAFTREFKLFNEGLKISETKKLLSDWEPYKERILFFINILPETPFSRKVDLNSVHAAEKLNREIEFDLKKLKDATPALAKTTVTNKDLPLRQPPTPKVSVNVFGLDVNNINLGYLFTFLIATLSSFIAYFLGKNISRKNSEYVPFTVVDSPIQSIVESTSKMICASKENLTAEDHILAIENSFETTNEHQPIILENSKLYKLEEIFRKTLVENHHLLKISSLEVINPPVSPYDTSVATNTSVKFPEAFYHLFKGAVTLANNSDKKPSFLEWQCVNEGSRSKFSITLQNGVITETQILRHTLMDEDESAPAYFERTETLLDGFNPLITLENTKQGMTVSLSMERCNSISH